MSLKRARLVCCRLRLGNQAHTQLLKQCNLLRQPAQALGEPFAPGRVAVRGEGMTVSITSSHGNGACQHLGFTFFVLLI